MALRRRTSASAPTPTAQTERQSRLAGAQGAITDTRHFPIPIQGLVGSEPVRILSTGNVPGLSPGLLVVDTDGNLEWIALSQVQVNDPNFLPAILPKMTGRMFIAMQVTHIAVTAVVGEEHRTRARAHPLRRRPDL